MLSHGQFEEEEGGGLKSYWDVSHVTVPSAKCQVPSDQLVDE